MSTAMNHEEARDALEALALDALDASERVAVLAHVRDCPECRTELESLERTAEALSQAAAPIAMSPAQRERIRARLLARAGADRGDARVVPISAAPSARRGERANLARVTAIAATIVAVACLGVAASVMRERDRLRDSLRYASAERGAGRATIDSLEVAVADRDRLIANLTGPDVHMMTLASTQPSSPTARMFWDQSQNAWVLVAHRMARPKAGMAYQLWLVTPTQKISAGMLMPDAKGDAMLRATYALPKDQLAAVAVTEEPMPGSAQPTSAPMLLASTR